MIKVILVDDDTEPLGALQEIFSEHFKQVDIKSLLENFRRTNENQRVALPDSDGMNFFEANRIIYCVNDNSTTYFHIKTDDPKAPVRRLAISKGLGHWEDFLFEKGFFFRVHNRYMVNINYIKRFVKIENSYLVMEHFQEHVPIARSSKNDFVRFLKTKGMVL